MAFLPISRTFIQYVDINGDVASGRVLKPFAAGTSTPISFATDNTGSVLVGTVALNAEGYPEVSGNEIIPHIDQNFKLIMYPDQTSADGDTGALRAVRYRYNSARSLKELRCCMQRQSLA